MGKYNRCDWKPLGPEKEKAWEEMTGLEKTNAQCVELLLLERERLLNMVHSEDDTDPKKEIFETEKRIIETNDAKENEDIDEDNGHKKNNDFKENKDALHENIPDEIKKGQVARGRVFMAAQAKDNAERFWNSMKEESASETKSASLEDTFTDPELLRLLNPAEMKQREKKKIDMHKPKESYERTLDRRPKAAYMNWDLIDEKKRDLKIIAVNELVLKQYLLNYDIETR